MARKKHIEAEIKSVAMTTEYLQAKPIEKNIEPEYVKGNTEFVEFLMDANVHWLGRNYKTGDQDELNIDDVEKLKLTKHVKIIERKK